MAGLASSSLGPGLPARTRTWAMRGRRQHSAQPVEGLMLDPPARGSWHGAARNSTLAAFCRSLLSGLGPAKSGTEWQARDGSLSGVKPW